MNNEEIIEAIEEQFSEGDSTTDESSDSEEDDAINPTWSPMLGQGLKNIRFTGEQGFLKQIPGNNTPIDWFWLLLDITFLQTIVTETNEYAHELFFGPSTTINSRICKWKDLTIDELKIFIGLLFHTGTIRLNRLNDYWKKHRLLNLPAFREYMSRDRFLLILRCLHISRVGTAENPEPTDDRAYKIRPLVEYFNNKMREIYYPGKELTIDEEMVLWRGRLVFRQYIKGKRHKYGIKIYSLNEPEGLLLRFHVYTGKTDPCSGKGHTVKIVMQLTEDFLGKGHALFMDNFYNSFLLASKLLHRKTYCTGTLRADRKHTPAMVKGAHLAKGETVANFADNIMIAKWRDKRTVMYISSQFDNSIVQVTNKRRQEKQIPKPVMQYNAHMKGVDRLDQMLSYYPCERKTLRWPKKFFIHFLQMIMINSYYLHNIYNINERMNLYDFRFKVIEELLPQKPAEPMLTPGRNTLHRVSKTEERTPKGDRRRKACRVCTKEGTRKQTIYICAVCPDKPGLCEVECFEKYHENVQ